MEEIYQAGFELAVPPIDIMFEFWINKIVKMQASLTNRAIISLLFDKYRFVDVLEHFKKIFFGQRGDLLGDITEEIFDIDSVMNLFSVMNINTLFKAFESEKLQEIKFKLTLKKDANIEAGLSVLRPVISLKLAV